MSSIPPRQLRLLIINPNTSRTMTEALRPVVNSLGFDAKYTFFTCPSPGVTSINSPSDASDSALFCLTHVRSLLHEFDGFLVACYSPHPLVRMLKQMLRPSPSDPRIQYVLGIFEASIAMSLALMPVELSPSAEQGEMPSDATTGAQEQSFGIVSTSSSWKKPLEEAVEEMLGTSASKKFLGCETTGLNASELHELPADQVKVKMMEATARLINRGLDQGRIVSVICLGCAGMSGMDLAVREACVVRLGAAMGLRVKIVDGVKAGIGSLIAMCKGGF